LLVFELKCSCLDSLKFDSGVCFSELDRKPLFLVSFCPFDSGCNQWDDDTGKNRSDSRVNWRFGVVDTGKNRTRKEEGKRVGFDPLDDAFELHIAPPMVSPGMSLFSSMAATARGQREEEPKTDPSSETKAKQAYSPSAVGRGKASGTLRIKGTARIAFGR
jgi:hypothetical protein